MNKTVKSLMLGLILSAGPVFANAESATLSTSDAESVVLRYLDALIQGDTVTIKNLLGGEHLESSRNMLDNPNYPDMLSSMYGTASYEIVKLNHEKTDTISVDTIIRLNSEEQIYTRFILTAAGDQGLKIVDETESEPALRQGPANQY